MVMAAIATVILVTKVIMGFMNILSWTVNTIIRAMNT